MATHFGDPFKRRLIDRSKDVSAASQNRVQRYMHRDSKAKCVVQTAFESCKDRIAGMIVRQSRATPGQDNKGLCFELRRLVKGSQRITDGEFISSPLPQAAGKTACIADRTNFNIMCLQAFLQAFLTQEKNLLPANADHSHAPLVETLNLVVQFLR